MTSNSSSHTEPALARAKFAQAHQCCPPPKIERYIREIGQYSASLSGQRQDNSPRAKLVSQYVHNWEQNWKSLGYEGDLGREGDLHGNSSPSGGGEIRHHRDVAPTCTPKGIRTYNGEDFQLSGEKGHPSGKQPAL